MPAACYLRVSTEEQRERQSIATQREFAEKYTALDELAVFRTYADDGVSGTVPIEDRLESSRCFGTPAPAGSINSSSTAWIASARDSVDPHPPSSRGFVAKYLVHYTIAVR
ncbi:MAG: recombinase family protein [Bryobacteraceae bacterium]|jgi:hypothetical protein